MSTSSKEQLARLEKEALEKAKSFAAWGNNVHAPHTNNSVGQIHLRLWERYAVNLYYRHLKARLTDDTIAQAFAKSPQTQSNPIALTQWLDHLSVEETSQFEATLKSAMGGDQEAPLKKMVADDLVSWMKSIETLLNEEERAVFNEERSWFAENLTNYASRKPDKWDEVQLFNPSTGKKEEHTMKMWKVLWNLIMVSYDDTCFNDPTYTRTDRLLGLYRLLKFYFKHPEVCNTGARNSITRQLLHLQYRARPHEPLVYVLTEVSTDIRELITKHYTEKLEQCLQAQATLGYRIVCQWIEDSLEKITEDKRCELNAFFDDEEALKRKIENHFIYLGVDPSAPEIEKPIREWVAYRAEQRVPTPPGCIGTIHFIQQLKRNPDEFSDIIDDFERCREMSEVARLMGPRRREALLTRIMRDCAIIPFGKREGELITIGRRIENELHTMLSDINPDYFLKRVNEFEDEFEAAVVRARQDDQGASIGNSFAILAQYTDDPARFREQLHDFMKRTTATVSNDHLKELLCKLAEIKEDKFKLKVTPRIVNSLIWHSVRVSPADYSSEFCEVLQHLIVELKKKQKDDNTQTWISSSYPNELIAQLEWLLECALTRVIEEIPEKLFMPCNLQGLQFKSRESISDVYYEDSDDDWDGDWIGNTLIDPLQERGWWFGLPDGIKLTHFSSNFIVYFIFRMCSLEHVLSEVESHIEEFSVLTGFFNALIKIMPEQERMNLVLRYWDRIPEDELEMVLDRRGLRRNPQLLLAIESKISHYYQVKAVYRSCYKKSTPDGIEFLIRHFDILINYDHDCNLLKEVPKDIPKVMDALCARVIDFDTYKRGCGNFELNESELIIFLERHSHFVTTAEQALELYRSLKERFNHVFSSPDYTPFDTKFRLFRILTKDDLEYEEKFLIEFEMRSWDNTPREIKFLCRIKNLLHEGSGLSLTQFQDIYLSEKVDLTSVLKHLIEIHCQHGLLNIFNRWLHCLDEQVGSGILRKYIEYIQAADRIPPNTVTPINEREDHFLQVRRRYIEQWELSLSETPPNLEKAHEYELQVHMAHGYIEPNDLGEGLEPDGFHAIQDGNCLSDRDILVVLEKNPNADHLQFTDIGNRKILLHAITLSPAQWSPHFYHLLKKALPLESDKCHHIAECNFQLLAKYNFQLYYLLKCYETKQIDHTVEDHHFRLPCVLAGLSYGDTEEMKSRIEDRLRNVFSWEELPENLDPLIKRLMNQKHTTLIKALNRVPLTKRLGVVQRYWKFHPCQARDLKTLTELLPTTAFVSLIPEHVSFADYRRMMISEGKYEVSQALLSRFSGQTTVYQQLLDDCVEHKSLDRWFAVSLETGPLAYSFFKDVLRNISPKSDRNGLKDFFSKHVKCIKTHKQLRNVVSIIVTRTVHPETKIIPLKILVSQFPREVTLHKKKIHQSLVECTVVLTLCTMERYREDHAIYRAEMEIESESVTRVKSTAVIEKTETMVSNTTMSTESSATSSYIATKDTLSKQTAVTRLTMDIEHPDIMTHQVTNLRQALLFGTIAPQSQPALSERQSARNTLDQLLKTYDSNRGFFRRYCPGIPGRTRTIQALRSLLHSNADITQEDILNVLEARDHRNSKTRKSQITHSVKFFNDRQSVMPIKFSATDHVVVGLKSYFENVC